MKILKKLIILSFLIMGCNYNNESVHAASGNAYIHYYKEAGYVDRTPTYTNGAPHLTSMGYTVYGYDNAGSGSALSQLQNGAIFVVHNHGYPGIQYMGSDGSGIVGSASSAGNGLVYVGSSIGLFSNLKIAILYGCKTGAVTSLGGDLPQQIVNKGATAAVAWTVDTPISGVNEWNRLFFEKAKDGSSIVESFRHADYWTASILGTSYSDPLQYYRNEKGNIYASIN